MKKFKLFLTLAVLLSASFCYAATEEAPNPQAEPVTIYGSTGSGIVKILVDASGNILSSNSVIAVARKETSQDLSAAVLDYTTNFAAKTKVKMVLIHASVAITETVTITLNSKTAATYDTVLLDEGLVAQRNILYLPADGLILESGDEIDVNVTADNTTGTVYVTVIGETLN